MNIFDKAIQNMYRTTTQIMGYDATWENSETSEILMARVHFKYPSKPEGLLEEIEYMPTKPIMEYFNSDFSGLKETADNNKMEIVAIDGIGSFHVESVIRKYDGKTLVATLLPVEE